jgi:hypothetical protein
MKVEEISYKIGPKKLEQLTISLSSASVSDIDSIEDIMDEFLFFGLIKKKKDIVAEQDDLKGIIEYAGRPYWLFGNDYHGSITLDCGYNQDNVILNITSSEEKAIEIIHKIRRDLRPELSNESQNAYERLRVVSKYDVKVMDQNTTQDNPLEES